MACGRDVGKRAADHKRDSNCDKRDKVGSRSALAAPRFVSLRQQPQRRIDRNRRQNARKVGIGLVLPRELSGDCVQDS